LAEPPRMEKSAAASKPAESEVYPNVVVHLANILSDWSNRNEKYNDRQ